MLSTSDKQWIINQIKTIAPVIYKSADTPFALGFIPLKAGDIWVLTTPPSIGVYMSFYNTTTKQYFWALIF